MAVDACAEASGVKPAPLLVIMSVDFAPSDSGKDTLEVLMVLP